MDEKNDRDDDGNNDDDDDENKDEELNGFHMFNNKEEQEYEWYCRQL